MRTRIKNTGNTETDARKVASWLRTTKNVIPDSVKPAYVTIAGTTYYGAQYVTKGTYTAGMGAVTHGITINGVTTYKKPGEEYTDNPRFYLLGALPKSYKRKTVYTLNIGGEWYIAGYINENAITAENREFHPFGQSFMVSLWSVPTGEKIDAHGTQRERMKCSVVWIV